MTVSEFSRSPAVDAVIPPSTPVVLVFDTDLDSWDTASVRIMTFVPGTDLCTAGVFAAGYTAGSSIVLSDNGAGAGTRITITLIPDGGWDVSAFYADDFGEGGVIEFESVFAELVDNSQNISALGWQFYTAAGAIDIDTAPVPGGELETAFTHTFTVTGATAPLVWSVASGTLPPGLTLAAATGVLSGTPTTTGTFTFTLQVTDANDDVDTEEFYMVVTGCVPRAVAETVGVLIARVRRETGDRVTDSQGNTITDPAFSDDDIRRSLNDTFIKIGKALRASHRGEALQAVDFAYTESATRRGMNLPAGVLASAVFQVEDVVDSSIKAPRPLVYVDMAELSVYDRSIDGIANLGNYYTLHIEDEDYRIMIRPQPASGRYFRIWYAATPLVTCDDAESLPIAAEWRELIGLDAAIRLLRYSGEVTPESKLALAEQWDQFHKQAKRNKGHQRVRVVPRG